jgi:hypothetical protein
MGVMSVADFNPGDRVHVEFDGVVSNLKSYRGEVWVNGPDSPLHSFGAGVTITRLDPENWPPQPGDIWEAGGREYAVLWAASPDNGGVRFHEVDRPFYHEVREVKTMNPRLVRRRGQ